MESERSLFNFKVRGQGHWALIQKCLHLDNCGQSTARTVQPILLKLSMYTSYGKRKKPIYFQDHRSVPLGLYEEFWYLDTCGHGIARTM